MYPLPSLPPLPSSPSSSLPPSLPPLTHRPTPHALTLSGAVPLVQVPLKRVQLRREGARLAQRPPLRLEVGGPEVTSAPVQRLPGLCGRREGGGRLRGKGPRRCAGGGEG